MNLEALPPEIGLSIFSNLSYVESRKSITVSKRIKSFVEMRAPEITDEVIGWVRKSVTVWSLSDNEFRRFIVRKSNNFFSLLSTAIADCHLAAVKILLAVGYDPNQLDDKLLPLQRGIIRWRKYQEKEVQEIIKALKNAGFNFNQHFQLAYELAMYRFRIPLFDVCLAQGLNINCQNPDSGRTLLHCMVRVLEDNVEDVRFLLYRKADPTIKDKQGQTPLDLARQKNCTEVFKLLSLKEAASAASAKSRLASKESHSPSQ